MIDELHILISKTKQKIDKNDQTSSQDLILILNFSSS